MSENEIKKVVVPREVKGGKPVGELPPAPTKPTTKPEDKKE